MIIADPYGIMGIILTFGANLSLILRFTKMKKASNIILGIMCGLALGIIFIIWVLPNF